MATVFIAQAWIDCLQTAWLELGICPTDGSFIHLSFWFSFFFFFLSLFFILSYFSFCLFYLSFFSVFKREDSAESFKGEEIRPIRMAARLAFITLRRFKVGGSGGLIRCILQVSCWHGRPRLGPVLLRRSQQSLETCAALGVCTYLPTYSTQLSTSLQ